MNGAVGRRVYGRRSTERTANAAPASASASPRAAGLVELNRLGIGEPSVAREVAALGDAAAVDGRRAAP